MIDQDEFALDLLKRHAPKFLRDARRTAKRTVSERTINVSLAQFDNTPLVLYAALYFAGRHGITIVVPPVPVIAP